MCGSLFGVVKLVAVAANGESRDDYAVLDFLHRSACFFW